MSAQNSPPATGAISVEQDVQEIEVETKSPGRSFPPYPPYAPEPMPPSVANAIRVGRDIRVEQKQVRPKFPAIPPPCPARPRGPKATDVVPDRRPRKGSEARLSKCIARAHARCMKKHNIVLSGRLEGLARPMRRSIIYLWRERADQLPADTIARLRQMLDADEPFKPDQAYQYFLNMKKPRKSKKAAKACQVQKDLVAVYGDKKFLWARNASVAFARGIQQRLAKPGRYKLTDGMLRLSNIVLRDLCSCMHCKTPSRRCPHQKAKFMMEMADKVAVWIDEILADSDDRMLMMDFDEDEDVLEADGFADSFLDMMGGAGGKGWKGKPPAYLKFTGDDMVSFKLLTGEMKKKGTENLVTHGKASLSYSQGASELQKAESFDAPDANPEVAKNVKKKLGDISKPVTPPNIQPAMNKMVDTCGNYIAQVAENNKDKGPAFKLMVNKMKELGPAPLFQAGKIEKTYAKIAKDLESAKGLKTDHDDPVLSAEINNKLATDMHGVTPSELEGEMKETMQLSSKYLAQKAADEDKALDHLVDLMKKQGDKPFAKVRGQDLTYNDAAKRIENTTSLKYSHVDKNTSDQVKDKLDKIVEANPNPAHAKVIADVIREAANFLSASSDGGFFKGSPGYEEAQKLLQSGKLTADDIERLLREGKISPEEAARLRAQLAGGGVGAGSPGFQEAQKLLNSGKLTAEDIDRLLREGKISPEEAARLKAQLAGGAGGPGSPGFQEAQNLLRSGKLTADDIERLLREGKISPEEAARLRAQLAGGGGGAGSPGFQEAQKLLNSGKLTAADIDRLLREGKISPEEAARLRAQLAGGAGGPGSPGFQEAQNLLRSGKLTADDIERLLREGKISPEEAARLRAQLAGGAGGAGGPGSPGFQEAQKLLQSGKLTADDIERLLREGKISPEEAARLRAQLAGGAGGPGSPGFQEAQNLLRSGKLTADDIERLLREGKISPEEAARLRAQLAGGAALAGAAGGAAFAGAAGGAALAGGVGSPGFQEALKLLNSGKLTAEDIDRLLREGKITPEEAERLRKKLLGVVDPEKEQALKILHQELNKKGNEVLYSQPHTELTYSKASSWLKMKPPMKVEKAVKESGETDRLSQKFEKKLANLVDKSTPVAMKDTMQDSVIESSRILSENFVSQNYKALAKEALIAEMQKRGNEILIEVNGVPESYIFAAQRLKKAKSLVPKEPCHEIAYVLSKKLEDMIRGRPLPRKMFPTMKEHAKEAADYLSEVVTKPDPDIEAYVALLGEMEAAGDALLIDADIKKSFKEAAIYLKSLTSEEDKINRGNGELQSKAEKKLNELMSNVPPSGYSQSNMKKAVKDASKFLVSYVMLQREKTKALQLLTDALEQADDAVLLRHGNIRKTHADGAELLQGKNADELKVANVDPVVARKVKIKLDKLMTGHTPDKFKALMNDVIEEATDYLAVNLLDTPVESVCKCMKEVFVQCELWCEEILRRVGRPCCTCSRHVSAAALADLVPGTTLRLDSSRTHAYAPGLQVKITQCPSNPAAPCPAARPMPSCSHRVAFVSIPRRGSSPPTLDSARRERDAETTQRGRDMDTTRRGRDTETIRRGRDAETTRRGRDTESTRRGRDTESTRRGREMEMTRRGRDMEWTRRGREMETSRRGPDPETSRRGPDPETSRRGPDPETSRCGPDPETSRRAPDTETSWRERDSDSTSSAVEWSSTSPEPSHWQTPTIMYSTELAESLTPIPSISARRARSPVVTTDQMCDWHAMMVSLLWNMQAWRQWIQEKIDRALTDNSAKSALDSWNCFQRRVAAEALQWRQYNIFSRQLVLRLSMRYKEKQIVSPTRATDKTKTYMECQQDMLEIVHMFHKWTQWLTAIMKETNSLQQQNSTSDISQQEMCWSHFKSKVQENAGDWLKYNMHLKLCWEQKYGALNSEWLRAWKQTGPVWVMSACGAVPSGAVAAGTYDQEVIWVARTTHSTNVLPAALHPSKHCCIVYADGKIHHYTKYQVMCNAVVSWVPWRAGSVPARGVRVAPDVFAGRVMYRDQHLIGAVHAPVYRCHVVIFGRPFAFNCYEVLVLADFV